MSKILSVFPDYNRKFYIYAYRKLNGEEMKAVVDDYLLHNPNLPHRKVYEIDTEIR